MSTVNLSAVHDLLGAALDRAIALDGREIPERMAGKSRSAELAEINKDLVFLSHLLDKARVLTLDAYQSVRGFDEHLGAA